MHPNTYEIEEVGNAFISIGDIEYTPEQQNYLINFLRGYGHDLNQDAVKKIFKDKLEVVDALKILHEFANHYQDEKEIYPEFRDEIEELMITLNGKADSIII